LVRISTRVPCASLIASLTPSIRMSAMLVFRTRRTRHARHTCDDSTEVSNAPHAHDLECAVADGGCDIFESRRPLVRQMVNVAVQRVLSSLRGSR
jgi:hypothetical protein